MEYVVDPWWSIESKTVAFYYLDYRILGVLRVELLGWSIRMYVLEV